MQDLKVLTKEEKDGLDIPRISEDQKTTNSLGKKVYICLLYTSDAADEAPDV
jgi:tRNA-2-methylthio-N6-dimethylallyladenosine synthase